MTTEGGKIKVVIKKSPVKVAVPAVYETKVEVVKESKLKYRRDQKERRTPSSSFSYSSHSDSGSTMADFFRLSKEREEERKNRKKK